VYCVCVCEGRNKKCGETPTPPFFDVKENVLKLSHGGYFLQFLSILSLCHAPNNTVALLIPVCCSFELAAAKLVPTTMASNKASKSNNKGGVAAPSLNVYKKVAVIRHPSDSLTYEDAEGNLKSVSVQQLGDAIATAVRFRSTVGFAVQCCAF